MVYLMLYHQRSFNQLWIDIRVLTCYKQAVAYYVADAVTSPSRFQIRSIRAIQACTRRAVSLNIAPETTKQVFPHKSARAKIHLSMKCNHDFATTRARRTRIYVQMQLHACARNCASLESLQFAEKRIPSPDAGKLTTMCEILINLSLTYYTWSYVEFLSIVHGIGIS